MTTNPCAHSASLLAASRTLGLDPAAHEHLADCPACRDALVVDAALRSAAAASVPRQLPDPGLLLFRARRAATRAERERALAPIRFWERLATGAGVVLAALLVAAKGKAVLAALGGAAATTAQPVQSDPLAGALLLAIGAALALSLLWFSSTWAED